MGLSVSSFQTAAPPSDAPTFWAWLEKNQAAAKAQASYHNPFPPCDLREESTWLGFPRSGTMITTMEIPDYITRIEDRSFERCSMTSVIMPDSVTSIGLRAFYECKSLTSVTIPDSITSIDSSAFERCESLTSVIIPNSVTSISGSAFASCTSLTSLTIPDSVTSIGGGAFSTCAALTSVNIPSSVTSIGASAFSGCKSLTSVTIPDSVTSIGVYALKFGDHTGASALTSATIPAATSIGLWHPSKNSVVVLTLEELASQLTSGILVPYETDEDSGICIPEAVTLALIVHGKIPGVVSSALLVTVEEMQEKHAGTWWT